MCGCQVIFFCAFIRDDQFCDCSYYCCVLGTAYSHEGVIHMYVWVLTVAFKIFVILSFFHPYFFSLSLVLSLRYHSHEHSLFHFFKLFLILSTFSFFSSILTFLIPILPSSVPFSPFHSQSPFSPFHFSASIIPFHSQSPFFFTTSLSTPNPPSSPFPFPFPFSPFDSHSPAFYFIFPFLLPFYLVAFTSLLQCSWGKENFDVPARQQVGT